MGIPEADTHAGLLPEDKQRLLGVIEASPGGVAAFNAEVHQIAETVVEDLDRSRV